jgi:hypothetical protein
MALPFFHCYGLVLKKSKKNSYAAQKNHKKTTKI